MVLVELLFYFKNDKVQHVLKIFQCKDWFLENKSGVNFLGLKTKLALICNIAKGLM